MRRGCSSAPGTAGSAGAETGSRLPLFGTSVALCADGGRAVVSGTHRAFKWGVWMLVNAPTVAGVNPLSGPTSGGTTVVIDGTGFTGVRGVTFGEAPAASFTVESPLKIRAVSLPLARQGRSTSESGISIGTSATMPTDRFTYLNRPTVLGITPWSGPTSGGTSVRITGADLLAATLVSFGTVEAQFKVDDATQITAVAPPDKAPSTSR